MATSISYYLKDWLRFFLRPPQPGLVYLYSKRKVGPMGKFGIKFSLPGASSSDVLWQRLSVAWGDETSVLTDYPPGASISNEYVGELPATIHVRLTNLDETQNESDARTRDFSEVDDVAPPLPGEIGIAEKRQIE